MGFLSKENAMKVAFLSDVHSNYHALMSCYQYIEKSRIDYVCYLGDYISDLPYPVRTIEAIKEFARNHTCFYIKGNREEYMENAFKNNILFKKGSQQGSLLYTFENLRNEDIAWFMSLPVSSEVAIGDYAPFGISHGGYDNSRDIITICDNTAYDFIKKQRTRLHVLGHSHKPFLYKRDGKILLNPGSVGVPVSGRTRAQMAVVTFHSDTIMPDLVELSYDTEAAVREFYESGLLEYADVWARTIIAILKTGEHYNERCIQLVKKLSEQSGRDFSDEELWQNAAEMLGI